MSVPPRSHRPTEAERDEKIRLDSDLPLTFDEGLAVLLAVRPSDLPDDDQEDDR